MDSGWAPPPRLLIVCEQSVVSSGLQVLLEEFPDRVELLAGESAERHAADPDIVLYDVLRLRETGTPRKRSITCCTAR